VVGQKHLPEGKTQMRDLNYQLKQLCDRNRHGNCRIHTKQGIQTPGDIAVGLLWATPCLAMV